MTVFLLPILLFSQEKSRREIVSELFDSVEYWMGTPYVLGGNTKTGIDCSGFVVNVYKKVFNKQLPRTVAEQKAAGVPVKGTLQPGDLVFFITHDNTVSHVGIYVFDGKFIHAASAGSKVGVIKSSLKEPYYQSRYVYARRIIDLPPYVKEEYEVDRVDSLQVRVGNILYKEKVFTDDEPPAGNEPFYIEVENSEASEQLFKISVTGDKSLEYNSSTVTIQPGRSHTEKIILEPGTYEISVYNKAGNTLYRKQITVQ